METRMTTRPPLPPIPWYHYAASAVAATLLTLGLLVVARMILGDLPGPPADDIRSAGEQAYMTSPPLPVLIHLATVLPAIPLGIFVLLRRKGDRLHKIAGRVWMALMLTTAIASLFIHSINSTDNFFGLSPIHLFSFLTLWSVPSSIYYARTGNILAHKQSVTGLFIGGLVIAGMFSFMPGRFMWLWLFG
jgi:uncharacterized membrane protein